MTRYLLALAVAGALATTLVGCSDSDSDGSDTTPDVGTGDGSGGEPNGGGDGDQTFTPRPDRPDGPRGSGAPSGDTKAGNYFGTLGFGDGVYVIDARNELFGLVLDPNDSSARSFFGNVGDAATFTGTLRTYEHNASNPPSAGGFGTGPTSQQVEDSPGEYVTGEYTLQFAPGDAITATDAEGNVNTLAFADDNGQLVPISASGVAGAWRGVNEFGDCSGGGDCRLVFDLGFEGTAVSGTTSVQNAAGERSRENAIAGDIEEYGDALLLTFSWTDGGTPFVYEGTAFFAPDGTGRLVFLGETNDERAGLPVLASLLLPEVE